MTVIFPCDPDRPEQPDAAFAHEVAAARAVGLLVGVVDHDAAARGEVDLALRHAPRGPGPVVYRGWMLRAARYAALHAGLVARGFAPLTSPSAYATGHHLPRWYPQLAAFTPRSVWVEGEPLLARAVEAARAFGDAALIVKDFVKSEKHLWEEACFVPRADDAAALERVVRRFLAERGADLEGGLVLREFVPLERVGEHPRSGMPISVEARAFLLEGAAVHVLPYWEGTAARVPPPPIAPVLPALRGLGSPFLAVDLARRADGEWLLLEVGDGQVSGLPEDADPAPLFLALARCLRRLGPRGSEEPRRARGDGPAARSDPSDR